MPSDTFTHTTISDAHPERVFGALQEPTTWKGIGPIEDVWDATHDNGSLTGFAWSARAAGRTWGGTAVCSAHQPNRSMTLELDSSEIAGAITVELEPEGTGSKITVTLYARSKGLLSGMFWGVVSDALADGLTRQVDGFGDSF